MGIYVVVAIAFIVAVAIWLARMFNLLVAARNQTQEAWSEVDVELKRRHDLIPNLVQTVGGYAGHEAGALKAVTEARASAVDAGASRDPSTVAAAEGVLSQAVRSLFAVAENYPNLKAVATFVKLQEQLAETENRIEASRRTYNEKVRLFNTNVQTVPMSLMAAPMGFKPFAFYEAPDTERAAPVVGFKGAPSTLPSQAPEPGVKPPGTVAPSSDTGDSSPRP